MSNIATFSIFHTAAMKLRMIVQENKPKIQMCLMKRQEIMRVLQQQEKVIRESGRGKETQANGKQIRESDFAKVVKLTPASEGKKSKQK